MLFYGRKHEILKKYLVENFAEYYKTKIRINFVQFNDSIGYIFKISRIIDFFISDTLLISFGGSGE